MARHFDTRFPAMRQVNAISLESVATLLSLLAIFRPDFCLFTVFIENEKNFSRNAGYL